MLRVPLLPEVNAPDSILFDYGSYFTRVCLTTLRRTQGHRKGQKLLVVFKLKTSDVKHFIELYWRSASNSALVYLYNNPSEDFKTTIMQCFKHVKEESYENVSETNQKGLNFLMHNVIDELIYFPYNPEPDEYNFKHLEWSILDYPCLAVEVKENPCIHVFSDSEKSKTVETSMLKPLSAYINVNKEELMHNLTKVETQRITTEHSQEKPSAEDDACLAGFYQWLESIANAVKTVAAENSVNEVYVTECEFGLTNTLMSAFHGALSTQNSSKLFFSRHADMISAVGASIGPMEIVSDCSKWAEDVTFSTGLYLHGECICEENLVISQLVLEDLDMEFTRCPHFIEPDNYQFEIFNLNKRKICQFTLPASWKLLQAAMKPASKNDTVFKDVCEQIKPQTDAWLNYTLQNPSAFGKLYSTSLIAYVTFLSRHFGLRDWLKKIKDQENDDAINCLEARLLQIDRINDPLKKQVELFLGMIGGNLWDWLAPEYHEMKASGIFDIYTAIDKIPERPWAIDNVDAWTERLAKGYKKAIIFTDNSGADFILGILLFARELLKSGCHVIFCSNNEPVLNDVTYKEVPEIMKTVSHICPILKECWESGQLKAIPLGQRNATLDLRHIPCSLATEMNNADLYVFQGMARSVISNFKINMKLDYLQIWLVKGLSQMNLLDVEVRKMDGVCIFKQASKAL